jgi:hypothetical protein
LKTLTQRYALPSLASERGFESNNLAPQEKAKTPFSPRREGDPSPSGAVI